MSAVERVENEVLTNSHRIADEQLDSLKLTSQRSNHSTVSAHSRSATTKGNGKSEVFPYPISQVLFQ